MAEAEIRIRVIVFKDGDQWVAQCLEHDIGAQSDDIDDLNERLQVVLNAELKESIERGGKPFDGIDPAPKRFHLMWDRRARSVEIKSSPSMTAQQMPVSLDLALAA